LGGKEEGIMGSASLSIPAGIGNPIKQNSEHLFLIVIR
jgi:hypothetical protein